MSAFSAFSHVGFLSIILNGQTTCALIDSPASDYFVREKFMTPNIVREDVKYVIYTASENQKIHVRTACFLPVTIAGYTEEVRCLVSNELRNDVTLGRSWLKASKAKKQYKIMILTAYISEKQRAARTCCARKFFRLCSARVPA